MVQGERRSQGEPLPVDGCVAAPEVVRLVNHRAAPPPHHGKDGWGRSQPPHPQHPFPEILHILASPLQFFDPRPIRKLKLLYHLPRLASGRLHTTSTPSRHSPGTSLPTLCFLFLQDQGNLQQVSVLVASAPNANQSPPVPAGSQVILCQL